MSRTVARCFRLAALALLVAGPADVDAGCRGRRAARVPTCGAPGYAPAPGYALATAQSSSYAAAAAPADLGAFAAWLNAERAARGLAPCSVDAVLVADAAENSRRGFGHSFLGRARRQNVGVGPLPTVCVMWVASPAHASALFDPTITRVGLAQVGGVTTFSAS